MEKNELKDKQNKKSYNIIDCFEFILHILINHF